MRLSIYVDLTAKNFIWPMYYCISCQLALDMMQYIHFHNINESTEPKHQRSVYCWQLINTIHETFREKTEE